MDGSTVYRQTPEVGAVCINVHARICAGGGNAFPYRDRKVAGWTARKPERDCIFHLRHEPAKGCRAIIPRFSEGSAPRWERSAVSDSPAGKNVVPAGETIRRRDEVQAIAMP